MIITMQDAPAMPGGKALMLCQADGTPIPMQIAGVLNQDFDGVTFNVTLRVDGETVRLV